MDPTAKPVKDMNYGYRLGRADALAESRKACPCECHDSDMRLAASIDEHTNCGQCAAYQHGKMKQAFGAMHTALDDNHQTRQQALEDACRAMCEFCDGEHAGYEATPAYTEMLSGGSRALVHKIKAFEGQHGRKCDAEVIRRMMAEERQARETEKSK